MANKVNPQVSVRLTEEQHAELMDRLDRYKINKSTYLRELITKGEVNVRYDGQKVIKQMCQIQDNVNNYSHAVMDRLEPIERRLGLLEEQVKNIPQGRVPAPFRIDLKRLGVDVSTIRVEYQQQKDEYDKELTDSVRF